MRVQLPERIRPAASSAGRPVSAGPVEDSTPAAPVVPFASKAPATHAAPAVETFLTDLENQLNELRGQVRQAQQLASLGTAAATLAHEISNLLTPIVSYADSALRTDNPQLREKALTVTLKNAKMLVAMSGRILEIGAAKPAHRELVPVRQAAVDAVESLGRDPAKDSITFSNNVDEDTVAWCDPLQIRQLLFNLFLNARDVMAPSHGGRLKVDATVEGQRVTIEVTDTGGGIEPERLPHVFDPLHSSKANDATGKARCKGLGLALCRDLAEENGGTITVSAEQGVGTTFTITLPTADPNG